ncbi:aldose epimerase family protein [Rhizosaccharibacter radicis]|uniref:Aldose 1-epimerase n=1 Tax=Rhizosaccharibacter radicis TaxID=2782605 RepID=A0ABT1VUP7_9PROT|nr:galactose mutarotase [Acetobacteraceae bacterium KSS12]
MTAEDGAAAGGEVTLEATPFGTTADGRTATLFTLRNAHGIEVCVTDYGGIVTRVVTPDRQGRPADIVLGFHSLREYETKSADGNLFFGALIGRFANRIARGRFTLDGHEYVLDANNGSNTLHGGRNGFDKRLWEIAGGKQDPRAAAVTLRLVSPDGDGNFPGTLVVHATYTLADDGLRIDYEATTDKPTVINLTNHAYFNLAGVGSAAGVGPQLVRIHADRYLPTDPHAIPTGEMAFVAGTPFDFRTFKRIDRDIRADDPQLAIAQGFDHNWILNRSGNGLQPAAEAYDPASGRTLECLTTEPGVQFYTGNFLAGTYAGRGGLYRQTDGFTLETQHFPDSPNQPDFPSTVLRPGERFRSSTLFRFGIRAD